MSILQTGRNAERPKALFEFTQGIAVDRRLARQEVAVQTAWARALARIGVLSGGEAEQATLALQVALSEIEAGTFEWRIEDEDIHMNLERYVTERHGALGKKMHLGRSRNDLIATTLKLFVRDTQFELTKEVAVLIEALAAKAESTLDVIVPGLTHVQHGQPVRFGHALASHGWALLRDLSRIRTASERASARMPAGAAAMAGTPLKVDLELMARELGFAAPCLNSYDAVADRDSIVEGCDAMASLGVHLSRLSEDLIYWSSTAVGLVRLPKAWSTGSSIMPNKRNPDVPELVRGKSAHLIAAAAEAHILLKGVGTSYGSDLHEIKQIYLRALDETRACLAVLPPFVREMGLDESVARSLCGRGHILATEIADELAARGVPFRDAYAQVAALVEAADQLGVQIEFLPVKAVAAVAPALDPAWLATLTVEMAVERRANFGGTALAAARQGVEALRAEL
jgi:argininosuccinate lyase